MMQRMDYVRGPGLLYESKAHGIIRTVPTPTFSHSYHDSADLVVFDCPYAADETSVTALPFARSVGHR